MSLISQKNETVGKVVNIGSNTEISIENLIESIQKIMNKKSNIIIDNERLRPKSSEVFRLKCDYTLLKSLTDYEPSVNLKEGLQKTIEWYIKPENKIFYNAENTTFDDLILFIKKLFPHKKIKLHEPFSSVTKKNIFSIVLIQLLFHLLVII